MKESVNDCSVVIDKGSGIVIWDKQDYLKECKN